MPAAEIDPILAAISLERATQRPDWIEGVMIRLENGEEWSFPKPIVAFRLPRPGETDFTAVKVAKDTNSRFSDAFWTKQEKFLDLIRSDSGMVEVINAAGRLAVDLLQRNYAITDDQALDLLLLAPQEEANVEMWRQIIAVITGTGRKPVPAG